nr:hypothetical protein Iba_chr06cCG4730 [Ipomoea batatas]
MGSENGRRPPLPCFHGVLPGASAREPLHPPPAASVLGPAKGLLGPSRRREHVGVENENKPTPKSSGRTHSLTGRRVPSDSSSVPSDEFDPRSARTAPTSKLPARRPNGGESGRLSCRASSTNTTKTGRPVSWSDAINPFNPVGFGVIPLRRREHHVSRGVLIPSHMVRCYSNILPRMASNVMSIDRNGYAIEWWVSGVSLLNTLSKLCRIADLGTGGSRKNLYASVFGIETLTCAATLLLIGLPGVSPSTRSSAVPRRFCFLGFLGVCGGITIGDTGARCSVLTMSCFAEHWCGSSSSCSLFSCPLNCELFGYISAPLCDRLKLVSLLIRRAFLPAMR